MNKQVSSLLTESEDILQSMKVRELFDTVYQWGRAGVRTNHNAPIFQRLLDGIIKEVYSNGKRAGYTEGYSDGKKGV